jgi:hypothetical protein
MVLCAQHRGLDGVENEAQITGSGGSRDGSTDSAAGFMTHDHYQAHPKFGDGEL